MGYRFCRQIVYWCKKQGNKFYQKGKSNSPIFSTECGCGAGRATPVPGTGDLNNR